MRLAIEPLTHFLALFGLEACTDAGAGGSCGSSPENPSVREQNLQTPAGATGAGTNVAGNQQERVSLFRNYRGNGTS